MQTDLCIRKHKYHNNDYYVNIHNIVCVGYWSACPHFRALTLFPDRPTSCMYYCTGTVITVTTSNRYAVG